MKHGNYKALSISQFAKYCGTTRQTLQYYDKIGLLHPAITGEQGYRYYVPPQSYDIRLITTLKSMGCTLEEIKNIFDSGDSDIIFEVLRQKKQNIDEELKRLQESRQMLEKAEFIFRFNKMLPERPILADIDREFIVTRFPFKRLVDYDSPGFYSEQLGVSERCLSLSFTQMHPSGLIVPKDELLSGGNRLSYMFFLFHDSKFGENLYKIQAGRYLFYRIHAHYPFAEKRAAAYEALLCYIKESNLAVTGDALEIMIKIPGKPGNGDDFQIMLIVPVENRL